MFYCIFLCFIRVFSLISHINVLSNFIHSNICFCTNAEYRNIIKCSIDWLRFYFRILNLSLLYKIERSEATVLSSRKTLMWSAPFSSFTNTWRKTGYNINQVLIVAKTHPFSTVFILPLFTNPQGSNIYSAISISILNFGLVIKEIFFALPFKLSWSCFFDAMNAMDLEQHLLLKHL